MPLVNPAESQCSGVLFVRVPETNQHEKHKAGNRKEGQRKQNTTNHWCPLFSYPLASITLERSSREKGRPPQHTSPAACACLTARSVPACWAAPRRVSLNAAITCGSLERRLDDGASSPLIIHAFDVADQIADDFYLIDILVRDYDVREPIFDHDH